MKALCAKCHNYREVFFTISINGAKLNFCQPCQLQQRMQFINLLTSGDPKARAIFAVVSQALSKGSKIQ